MNANERLLTEAIQTYLQHKVQLGVPDPPKELVDADNKSLQHLHEQINDAFEIKTVDLDHHESICSAFRKIHSYQYITDSHFPAALEQELKSRGIPGEESNKALGFIDKVITEMGKEGWQERDAGWHPNLDEIIEVSQPSLE